MSFSAHWIKDLKGAVIQVFFEDGQSLRGTVVESYDAKAVRLTGGYETLINLDRVRYIYIITPASTKSPAYTLPDPPAPEPDNSPG